MASPDIELLWWDGCPSTEHALSDLRAALREAGLDPELQIRMTEVRTDAEAEARRFPGSPTILINGADVQPVSDDDEPGTLTCRIYRRRDGRISPTPDPDDLRDALRRAVTAHPTNPETT